MCTVATTVVCNAHWSDAQSRRGRAVKTLDDWLRDTTSASDPTAALEAAEDLAGDRAGELRTLLKHLDEHHAADRVRLRRVALRSAQSGVDEVAVSTVRAAGRVLVRTLGEAGEAERFFRAAGRQFATSPRRASWSRLVLAAHRLFDAPLIVNELADQALQHAQGRDERTALAVALHRIGRTSEAVGLLDALEAHPTPDAWALANAWRDVERPERAVAVLRAALQRDDPAEHLRVIQAFAGDGHSEQVTEAIAAADASATTADHWRGLARVLHRIDAGPDAVRARLERGVTAAVTAEERADLAAAYISLLRDAEAAQALGRVHQRPEPMDTSKRKPGDFPSDAAGLFDHLRSGLSSAQLGEIAAADWGMSYDEHLAALQHIVDTGRLQRPLPYEPAEVLALTRWSDGEGTDHLARAFACATLLLGDPDGHVNTWAPLVESALVLGQPALHLCESHAAWQWSVAYRPDGEASVAALWALAVLRVAQDPMDERLGWLVDQLAVAESCVRRLPAGGLAAHVLEFTVSAERWRHLTRTMLVPRRGVPAVARLLEVLGEGATQA